jgi:peroxiredoxin Q/BCP
MARSSTAKKAKTKTKTRLNRSTKKSKLPKRKAAKTTKSKKRPAKKAKKTAAKKTLTKKLIAKKLTTKKPEKNLAVVTSPAEITTPRVGAGDMAPDFSLPNQNGETVSLSDFRGKKVVLYFYPKDDTPGCTKEACSFRDNIPHFDTKDAIIFGISFDDANSHQKFIEKYGLNFQLLSDLDKEVAKKYGVYVQKNMYGNISWGIERSTFVIDREGRIAAAIRRVQVDGHTEEVLNILNSLS